MSRPAFCKHAVIEHLDTVIERLQKLALYDKGERRYAIGILKTLREDIRLWNSQYKKPRINMCQAMRKSWRSL